MLCSKLYLFVSLFYLYVFFDGFITSYTEFQQFWDDYSHGRDRLDTNFDMFNPLKSRKKYWIWHQYAIFAIFDRTLIFSKESFFFL